MDCGYLVSQHVLLIPGWVPGHLQTENTQQEARVPVEAGKVLQDVGVEGRTIRTHLKSTPELVLRPEDKTPKEVEGQTQTHLADVGHFSWFVV